MLDLADSTQLLRLLAEHVGDRVVAVFVAPRSGEDDNAEIHEIKPFSVSVTIELT